MDKTMEAALLMTYRRQLEEMQGADAHKGGNLQRNVLQSQVEQLQQQLWTVQSQHDAQAAQLAEAKPQVDIGSGQVPRMSPTLQRVPLPSDKEDWSKRQRKVPTFQELYEQLFGQVFDEHSNIVAT